MAAVIPGYDFEPNETPTAATLLKQATSMQISEIGIDELDAAVVGLGSGDVSNVTNALQAGDTVGSMWMSPLGDLWVQEQSGPVILHRIHGGWETARLFAQDDASFPAHKQPGVILQNEPGGLQHVSEDFFRVEGVSPAASGSAVIKASDSGSYENNKGGMHIGVLQSETAASTYHRVCWRGITMYHDREFGATTFFNLNEMQNGYLLKSPQGAFADPFMESNIWHNALPAWKHYSWVGAPSVGASKVSDVGGNHDWEVSSMVWAFGQIMYTNEQT